MPCAGWESTQFNRSENGELLICKNRLEESKLPIFLGEIYAWNRTPEAGKPFFLQDHNHRKRTKKVLGEFSSYLNCERFINIAVDNSWKICLDLQWDILVVYCMKESQIRNIIIQYTCHNSNLYDSKPT